MKEHLQARTHIVKRGNVADGGRGGGGGGGKEGTHPDLSLIKGDDLICEI